MNGERRLPPTFVTAIVIIVLAVGLAAYFVGRFGHSSRRGSLSAADLPEPGAPVPATVEEVATPAEIPPTVTPPIPVVVERGGSSSKVLVERSSQIVVPVPPAVPTLVPPSVSGEERYPTPRTRIVIEVRPTPTPTVPEVELRQPPPPLDTPVPPPPEPPPESTPEPEPTALPRAQ